ncbi:hypothetical protein [Rathayibacter toxicus]|uniref:Uncharacterized protein n=1 Tax=Rathayibacter toxicus TaxID=145458 RepID=A0A0C5BCA0_9MICO|nr:hypothetical protein [Rathayibacter toxicus]AJM76806.1 hypothetical protein TI83_00135 [Rathayibacter toxicus]ALS57434.1 hypothetical protein APU90_06345 [Rathayibacter toxicus]KKM44461.1 hypothetical protein VT73_09850 [Rathayibacter toxicus]PPG20901.1 hypothetical protein C5D15_10585 [Rathayibacter toxicus]PPG46005.1 hypothetical protein C5D16_10560 [Rathayibacter toxicus]
MKNQLNPITRLIPADDEWSIPHESGVGRRTLVQGAAWSVPAVTATFATAAHAASPAFTCPTVPPDSDWTAPAGFNGDTSGTGSYGWSTDDTEWQNTKDATQSGSLSYYLEFPVKVVAGHTYTFNWSAYANGAASGVSYVAYDVSIAGTRVYTASTDGNAGGDAKYLDPNTGTSTAANSSYTASQDGTIYFRYTIRLSRLTSEQVSNHNIVIKKPTISCS